MKRASSRVGYFVTRAAAAQQVTVAAEILTKGSTAITSTAMTRLISNIASRFGVAVSEKVAAQARYRSSDDRRRID